MAIIDNFTEEELRQIVSESKSYREVVIKLGYSTPGGNNYKTLKERLEKYQIDTTHFSTKDSIKAIRTREDVFCDNSVVTQAVLRRWFKKENIPYKCDFCGISEWQNQPLTLQLDHKNGKNNDNRLENLHWLCPNCHSQTDTFCGKQQQKNHSSDNGIIDFVVKNYCIECGKEISRGAVRCIECAYKHKRMVDRPGANELKQILIENNGNFTKVSKMFEVTDNAVRKWCKGYGMPTHSKDYKA